MNLIFDAHAHYDDSAFDDDREAVLSGLPNNGIFAVVNAAVDIETAEKGIRYAEKYPYMYVAAGFHPEKADNVPDDYIYKLSVLCSNDKVKAIGEIGLDYHYEDAAERSVQLAVAEEQIRLAKDLSMPIVFHDRDAHNDTLNLLKKFRPKGLVHCFSGSVEMLKEILKLGMSISLGGVVTFKNARVPVEVAAAVPLDRLLLETDAPYMTPVPFRGKRCDSAMIKYTAEKIAEIRGISVEEVLKITKENACRLYDIPCV